MFCWIFKFILKICYKGISWEVFSVLLKFDCCMQSILENYFRVFVKIWFGPQVLLIFYFFFFFAIGQVILCEKVATCVSTPVGRKASHLSAPRRDADFVYCCDIWMGSVVITNMIKTTTNTHKV